MNIQIYESGNYWVIVQGELAEFVRRAIISAVDSSLSREELLIDKLCLRISELETQKLVVLG